MTQMFVRFYASARYLHWAFYSQELSETTSIFFPRNTGCLIPVLQNYIRELAALERLDLRHCMCSQYHWLIHLLAINFLHQMESKDCALFCHQIEVSKRGNDKSISSFNNNCFFYILPNIWYVQIVNRILYW